MDILWIWDSGSQNIDTNYKNISFLLQQSPIDHAWYKQCRSKDPTPGPRPGLFDFLRWQKSIVSDNVGQSQFGF